MGNVPTADGTSATVQQGSLLVLDKNGNEVTTLADPKLLNGPWDLTVVDHGATASVFVSNVLSGTVTRIDLKVSGTGVMVQRMVQIASGYAHRTDPAALVLGPGGLAYDAQHDTLYVTSMVDNSVFAISKATKTTKDMGTGRLVYQDNVHLHGPIGLALAPNGDLITANGDGVNVDANQPSELVEFTKTGQFVTELSVDPTNGGAFGLAIGSRNGVTTLASVDDVTSQLKFYSIDNSFLNHLPRTPQTMASTVPSNGDVNPYGVAYVPANFAPGGTLNPGDILVSNFNNSQNLQGTGTTILRVTPGGQTSTFFQGPTGLGLTDALGILQRGFVIVGNVPTADGTAATVQQGSLLILDKNGNEVMNLTDPKLLDGPWGLAVVDHGATASLFVSNVLSGTVTRIDLKVSGTGVMVQRMVQIASGYAHRTDPAALVLGPGGLAYDAQHDTLYVTSMVDNSVFAISKASKTTKDMGTGRLVYQDNVHLHGPIGLALAPNGDLITANGDGVNVDANQPSELVEFTKTGQFVTELSVDPTNGGAFGLAIGSRNGATTLAAVDDVTSQLELFSLPPGQ